MKRKHWMLTPWYIIFALVMLLMAFSTYSYNIALCYVELGISLAACSVVFAMSLGFRRYISKTVQTTVEKLKGISPDFLEKYKYPIVVCGKKGDIVWCNSRFKKILCTGRDPQGEDISAYLSNVDVDLLREGEGVDVAVDGREYTVFCVSTGSGAVCHFFDNTYFKTMLREYQSTLPCVAVIAFDNADDFINETDEVYSEVVLTVESTLQKWAAEFGALYKKVGTNRYIIFFRESDVEKMTEAKFPVLKSIRSISVNNHTATISVGLCRGCKGIRACEANARKALEMALGRGGDQVAVIKDNSYEFFGGTASASEKVSKVRMRVIANAINRAAADCDKIYIMGHRFSDLDCLGAAVGMQCIAEKSMRKYSKIVISKDTSMAKPLLNYIDKKSETNIFVTPEEAIRGVTPRTLLIIVDTHIRSSLESSELYDRCKRVVVIDHHRKAVNHIDNALVFCHEPSASSASEMCSEIISYLDDKPLGYIQADALLAGIMLDTKNFVLKTGVRTFEAAAYLRRKGANTLTVKEMFSDSIETYREKVDIVCKANVYRSCAISTAAAETSDIRLAAAQAADEMLTLQGVAASFVIFQCNGRINISARSYGKINVQIIMEKLGGGGHQTMAAAQLDDVNTEQARSLLLDAVNEALDE